jgi:predicted acyl esterase
VRHSPHDELQKLQPGKVVEIDIEIWPACIVVPAGYRIALSIRGRDYEHEGEAATLSNRCLSHRPARIAIWCSRGRRRPAVKRASG